MSRRQTYLPSFPLCFFRVDPSLNDLEDAFSVDHESSRVLFFPARERYEKIVFELENRNKSQCGSVRVETREKRSSTNLGFELLDSLPGSFLLKHLTWTTSTGKTTWILRRFLLRSNS